jgi:putative Mg2+ transporter-C (MgtC) family protein
VIELMPAVSALDLVLRLGAATLAGSLIGLNRDLRHKPAGMRTHALVSIGAAGMMLLGLSIAADDNGLVERRAATQVVQGIITGIGFLGAGVIVRDLAAMQIHGLTTAATIWLSAAIGMVLGAAYWSAAGLMIVFTFVILIFGDYAEALTLKLWNREEEPEQQISEKQPANKT